MEGEIDPMYLPETELDYELRLREVITRSTLNSKRKVLARLLKVDARNEKNVLEYRDPLSILSLKKTL